MPNTSPLVVTQAGMVTVVRLARPLILSGEWATTVSDHLDQLLAAGQARIVFDFTNVRSVTSLMIGNLIALDKKVSAAGGALALCEVGPDLREVFDALGLPQLIRIYPTEQDALRGLGG